MKLKTILLFLEQEGGAPAGDGGDGSGAPAQGWGGDPTYTPNPPYGNYQPEAMKSKTMGKVTTKSLQGYKRPHVLFGHQIKNRIKKLIKKNNFLVFKEELNTAKFFYTNWKHDKFPQVKILDYHYTKEGEKTPSDDLIGWNLNYYSNKEEAAKTIDDIDSFARLISADNKEKYNRIKYFFPEQEKLIRRYKKNNIKNIKEKDGLLWKKTSLKNLEEKHKNNY